METVSYTHLDVYKRQAFDATVMCLGMDRVKAKMNEIRAKDKDASAVEQDMLTTLEVVYEFYLRGYTFDQMDLYRSDAVSYTHLLGSTAGLWKSRCWPGTAG